MQVKCIGLDMHLSIAMHTLYLHNQLTDLLWACNHARTRSAQISQHFSDLGLLHASWIQEEKESVLQILHFVQSIAAYQHNQASSVALAQGSATATDNVALLALEASWANLPRSSIQRRCGIFLAHLYCLPTVLCNSYPCLPRTLDCCCQSDVVRRRDLLAANATRPCCQS